MSVRLFAVILPLLAAVPAQAQSRPPAFAQCAACHSTEPGKTVFGPSLHGVGGRKAGSLPGYDYSPALKQARITWNAATLERARAALLPACQSGTLALVRRLDQSYDDGPQADFFARMMSELAGNAKFGPIYAAFHGQLRDLIEAELMRETGAPQPRCAEAAAAIMSMMVGIHAEHRIAPGRFNRTQYSAMLYQMVELLLADFNQSGR